MYLTRANAAPVTAGIVLGLAGLMFVDGVIVANKEPMSQHHFSFTMCIPAIFSVVGFLLFMLVSPQDIKEDQRRAKIVLFASWFSMFGSTVAGLVIVFFCFRGMQERLRAVPGVELVLFTALCPVASAILWWGRTVDDDEEDW